MDTRKHSENTTCGNARRLAVSRRRERGVAVTELSLALPILLILVMATVDFGRFIYTTQIVSDLAREAGMLVSRGATVTQAANATFQADGPLDVEHSGGMIVSYINRRSVTDGTPWITNQSTVGEMVAKSSRLGKLNGAAKLPKVKTLSTGVTLTAIEVSHRFEPLFPLETFGLNFYPDVVYNVAVF
jgi:Flp pilus assembly protein TadG